jgi:hypothetical protein
MTWQSCRNPTTGAAVEVARVELGTGQTTRDDRGVTFQVIASVVFCETIYRPPTWGWFRFGVREVLFRLVPDKCKLPHSGLKYFQQPVTKSEIEIEIREKRETREAREKTAKASIGTTLKEHILKFYASVGGSRNTTTETTHSSSQSRKDVRYLVNCRGTNGSGEAEWHIHNPFDDILLGTVFWEKEDYIADAVCEPGWTLRPEIELMPGCEIVSDKDIPSPTRQDKFNQALKTKTKLAAILIGKDVFPHVPLTPLKDVPR